MDASAVQTRAQLTDYLSQSLSGDYLSVVGEDEIAQTSTYVKTYLVEAHDGPSDARNALARTFPSVSERSDPTLLYLEDSNNAQYIADVSDPRFIPIHSLDKVAFTDAAIEKLTEGDTPGFDRAWMPSEFLFAAWRGKLTGFKFRFERAVEGITDSADYPIPDRQSAKSRRPRFRMVVNENFTALQDYEAIRDGNVFAGRQTLEHVQFHTGANGEYVSNGIYSNGKIIGNGTSIGAYLETVRSVASNYSQMIRSIEDCALGWEDHNSHQIHVGEPIIIKFDTDFLVADLQQLAESIFRPIRPFRLLGILHNLSEQRIDIEGIDLHSGDPFAVEMTKRWMRIYLPIGSCGNVVARLYTNLQRSMSSNLMLVNGSGEPLVRGRQEIG